MNENPLSSYFRTPAIHVALPSGGKFYPEGAIEMPPTGEVPVYPMTAVDEITYRTPDALFNGSATADVIKSCVPAIKDPWSMPAIDLSTLLTAIRIASFGHEMTITTTCPKCGNTADYAFDLRNVIDSIQSPNYDDPLPIGDLKVYFKPLTYKEINENSKVAFEENRIIEMTKQTDGSDEEKLEVLAEAFRKVSTFTIETIAANIDRIQTPEVVVDEYDYILDYLRNCENDIYKAIKSHIVDARGKTEIKPLHIKCDECGHEYEQPYSMDMSNFFE